MSNEVQGQATYHIIHNTEFGAEEFLYKFHPDNIIGIKLHFTLSDGSVHIMDVCEILEATVSSFQSDEGEDMTISEIEKEKITKSSPVIKIAI